MISLFQKRIALQCFLQILDRLLLVVGGLCRVRNSQKGYRWEEGGSTWHIQELGIVAPMTISA